METWASTAFSDGGQMSFVAIVQSFRPKDEVLVLKYGNRAQPQDNALLRLERDFGRSFIVRIQKTDSAKGILLAQAVTETSPAPRAGDWYMAHSVSESEAGVRVSGPSEWYFAPALGASSVTYRETGISDLHISAVNVSVTMGYNFGQVFAEGHAGITAFSVTTNNPTTDVHFVNANADLGVRLLPRGSAVQISLLGGAYVRSMLVTNNAFGFPAMVGPELYPRLSVRVGRAGAIEAYARFAPVMNGMTLMPVTNREISGGIAWRAPTGAQGISYRVGVEYSDLHLNVQGFSTQTSTLLLGAGLQW
jgi:hypothetical protein